MKAKYELIKQKKIRNEKRFLEVIHDRDIKIERYENALCRMENGLDVVEEPLSSRIASIIAVLKAKQLRSESESTGESRESTGKSREKGRSSKERKQKKTVEQR